MTRFLRPGPALSLGLALLCVFGSFHCLAADKALAGVEEKQVIPVSNSLAETGVLGEATYYAKRYEGKKTASGERYSPEKLTAAHPDLPFGTRVKVIHLRSQKEVVVTVNDRCRARRLSAIDLSKAAAKQLGLLQEGRARVRIVAMGEPPPAPTQPQTAD